MERLPVRVHRRETGVGYRRAVVRTASLAIGAGLVAVLLAATPAGAFPVGGGGGDDPPPDCVAGSTGTVSVSPTNPVAGQDVTVSWNVVQPSGCTVWKFVDGPGFSGDSQYLANPGSRSVRVDTQGFDSWSLSVTGSLANVYPLASASATASPGPQYGWGDNFLHQVNQVGGFTPLSSPTQARNQALDTVQEATNISGSVALHSDGGLWTWGAGYLLGTGSSTDRYWAGQVYSLPRITQVALGQNNVYALDASGTVWAWGDNYDHMDGPLAAASGYQLTPVRVPLPGPAVQVAQGVEFGMALLANGDVYTWGGDFYGELGDGTPFGDGHQSATPLKANTPPGITQIAAGGFFAVALGGDGNLYAWGSSAFGQVGQSLPVGRSISWPVRVQPAPAGITRIVGGEYHALLLTNSGNVYAWGDDEQGQLGDGWAHSAQQAPMLVPLPAAATQLVAGDECSFALLADGTVWTWGMDLRSPDFSGFTRDPVQVTGLSRVAWLTAGGETAIVSLAP